MHVYLLPTDQFRKAVSISPKEMFGTPISAVRYHDMKNTLYHFLAQKSILSYEHTDLRNIINHHALTTDGYQALYEIMERIHPSLDPNATYDIPTSTDYKDVHEYYNYMASYFMHESLQGQQYNPRQQVNLFLKGLDATYAVAVKRIRIKMDSWKVDDIDGPEDLQLMKLPNLVEK